MQIFYYSVLLSLCWWTLIANILECCLTSGVSIDQVHGHSDGQAILEAIFAGLHVVYIGFRLSLYWWSLVSNNLRYLET